MFNNVYKLCAYTTPEGRFLQASFSLSFLIVFFLSEHQNMDLASHAGSHVYV